MSAVRFSWEGRNWTTRDGYPLISAIDDEIYGYVGSKRIPLERRPAIVIAEKLVVPLGRWRASSSALARLAPPAEDQEDSGA